MLRCPKDKDRMSDGPMMFRQPAGHPANSTKYKKLRAAFFRRQGPVGVCAICGRPVNMAISGRHREGPTVDHIVPSSVNGDFWDLQNWQLAHRSCNSAKGRGPGIREEPVSPNA